MSEQTEKILPKLNAATLVMFETLYFSHDSRFQEQRYGQAIMNEFNLSEYQKELANETNLFNETDIGLSRTIAWTLVKYN